MRLKANLCLLASFLLVLSGCTSVQVEPEQLSYMEGWSFKLVEAAGHDEYGRPVFGEELKERPSEPGSLFVIVAHDRNGVPKKSFIVAVTDPDRPDMTRPLAVMFEWTTGGFVAAGSAFREIVDSELTWQATNEFTAALYLFFAGAMITIPIAAGIIGGVTKGTLETGAEAGKLLIKGKEVLASYSIYEYDDTDRITRTLMFISKEPPELLTSTSFTYAGDDRTPAEALTLRLIDDTKHKQVFKQ